MTPEQTTLQQAVFDDKPALLRLIKSISAQISAADTAAEIGKLRLLRIAVRAIAAARWGAGWQTT
jgi:hypothetical protein